MKNFYTFTLFLILISAQGYSDWQEYPSITMNGGGDSLIETGQVDRPVVAWTEYPNNRDIYLRQWNGSKWAILGNSPCVTKVTHPIGSRTFPSLIANSNGQIAVAWVNSGEIYLLLWDGNKWLELNNSASKGGVSNTANDSRLPNVAFDSHGNPYVAWIEATDYSGYQIYVKHWNGKAWSEIDNSASNRGLSTNANYIERPVIKLDGADQPYVAWVDDGIGILKKGGVMLKCLRNDKWKAIGDDNDSGSISKFDGTYSGINMNLDENAFPIVTWSSKVFDFSKFDYQYNQIYLRRWDGKKWIELGNSGSGGGITKETREHYNIFQPSVAFDRSWRPVVTWGFEGRIRIMHWDGKQWLVPTDNILKDIMNSKDVHNPSISRDAANKLYLIFKDSSNSQKKIRILKN